MKRIFTPPVLIESMMTRNIDMILQSHRSFGIKFQSDNRTMPIGWSGDCFQNRGQAPGAAPSLAILPVDHREWSGHTVSRGQRDGLVDLPEGGGCKLYFTVQYSYRSAHIFSSIAICWMMPYCSQMIPGWLLFWKCPLIGNRYNGISWVSSTVVVPLL